MASKNALRFCYCCVALLKELSLQKVMITITTQESQSPLKLVYWYGFACGFAVSFYGCGSPVQLDA